MTLTFYVLVLIGYRGSKSLKNWIADLQSVSMTPFDVIDPSYGMSIGQGFYDNYLSTRDDVCLWGRLDCSSCSPILRSTLLAMDSLSPSLAIYPFNRPSHFVDVFFTRLLPRSLSRQDRCCGHLPQPQYNRLRPLHLRITLYWKQGLRFPLQRDSPYGSASPDDLL